MTLQVKYLVGCVEKLIRGLANNEPYGVPGPSRPSQVGSGSQEKPIIISDDDTTIKMEIDPDVTDIVTSKKVGGKKSKESISRKGFKGAGDKKKSTKKIVSKSKGKAAVRSSYGSNSSSSDERTVSNKTKATKTKKVISSKSKGKAAVDSSNSSNIDEETVSNKTKSTKKIVSKSKGKAAVRPSDSPSSSDSDGSSSSSCSSSSDSLNSSNRSSFYLKKSDMPKDLREALRVNISKSIYYKLIY